MKVFVDININDKFEVYLTEYGYGILNKHIDDLFKTAPELTNKDIYKYNYLASIEVVNPINRRTFQFQLYELMNIFGPEMYNGNPHNCFMQNKIIKKIGNYNIKFMTEEDLLDTLDAHMIGSVKFNVQKYIADLKKTNLADLVKPEVDKYLDSKPEMTQEEINSLINDASDSLAEKLERFKNFSQTEEDARAILKDAEKI